MRQYTVGCVPYVNAIPLVSRFEGLGEESPVQVLYDVPSRLPAMLDSGDADAVLVSSIDALRVPGRRMAEGVCIGSHGPVKSVRLFSKTPPSQIRKLALDSSSMTSNRLAQIILKEHFGVEPTLVGERAPDLTAMLQEADACILIGDIGMTTDGSGLHVLDLGEEWRRLTGKPFVWAAWIGGEGLTSELSRLLNQAAEHHLVGRSIPAVPRHAEDWNRQQQVVEKAAARPGWSAGSARDYFMDVMVYKMDEAVLAGYRAFQTRLIAHGFTDCAHFPEIVSTSGSS